MPGLGLGTCAHAVPFQWSMRVRELPALAAYVPTAQALLAEVAATVLRTLSPVPGFGVFACVQAVPFQCSARVWKTWPAGLPLDCPTAQASLAVGAATSF